MGSSPVLVTLVDGDCALCSRYARAVSALDRRGVVYFETQQSERGQGLLRRVGVPSDLSTVVLIECAGENTLRGFTKSTAVLRTFRALGLPAALLYVFIAVPRVVRDWVYDVVASNRYRLFGTNGGVCRLPDGLVRRRMGRSLPPGLS